METAQTAASAFRWPRLRPRPALALLLAIVGGSMLQGWALHTSTRPDSNFLFVMFFSGAVAAWAALPILQTAVLNAPLPWRRPWAFIGTHVLGYACYALFTLVIGRSAIGVLFAIFRFDEPRRPFVADLLFEVQNSAPVYAAFALLLTAIEVAARQHAATMREATLEAALATTQFDALRARVPPEVMSAKLRDVQLLMADDLRRAESRIEKLGAELRDAFASEPESAPSSGSRNLPPLDEDEDEPRSLWPRIRASHAAIALGVCLSFSLLAGGAMQAALRTPGVDLYVLAVARAFGLWLALPSAYAAVLQRPDPRQRWLRYIFTHGIGQVVFVLVMTGFEYACAYLAMWLLAQPFPDTTFWSALLFEFQRTSQLYVVAVMLFTSLYFWSRERHGEQRMAKLEAKLAESQLQALSARLEPHFLYNALNTISALMHVDRALSARLLADLDGLLHAALAAGGATWTLGEERAHTQRYVEFIEARFGDRIDVQWSFEEGLDHATVPRFALQLLVENAVKHNQRERANLRIAIEGRKRGRELTLMVADDGRGFGADGGSGQGSLRRLEQTLALLHGNRNAGLTRGANAPAGARVQLRLPAQS